MITNEDGLRDALAYLRARVVDDQEARRVLVEHADLVGLADHLAWIATAVLTRPAQPSALQGVEAWFEVIDEVYPLGARKP